MKAMPAAQSSLNAPLANCRNTCVSERILGTRNEEKNPTVMSYITPLCLIVFALSLPGTCLGQAAPKQFSSTKEIIETVPKRGYRFVQPMKNAVPEASIAVLPFLNLTNDPENELFADGICEEIIFSLAQIRDLHVAARTSSFSFKGKNTNIGEIGRALFVAEQLRSTGELRDDLTTAPGGA